MAVVQEAGRAAGQLHAAEEGASTSAPAQQQRSRHAARDTGMQLAAASPAEIQRQREEYEAGKRRALEKVATEKQKRRWFGADSLCSPLQSPLHVRHTFQSAPRWSCLHLLADTALHCLTLAMGCLQQDPTWLCSDVCLSRQRMHGGLDGYK
jgi:hypothetical protein